MSEGNSPVGGNRRGHDGMEPAERNQQHKKVHRIILKYKNYVVVVHCMSQEKQGKSVHSTVMGVRLVPQGEWREEE